MKKLLLLLALSWFAVSCSVNITEDEFAGTYTCNATEHIDEDDQSSAMDISLSATTTYRANKTFYLNGKLSLGMPINENGYTNYVTLKFYISAYGQWQLTDGNKLVEQCAIEDVSISYADMKLKTMDEDGLTVAMYMLANIQGEIESMRQELANGATSKIVSFNGDKMELEDIEDDTRIEYTRISPLNDNSDFEPGTLQAYLRSKAEKASTTRNDPFSAEFEAFFSKFLKDKEFQKKCCTFDLKQSFTGDDFFIGQKFMKEDGNMGEGSFDANGKSMKYWCLVPSSSMYHYILEFTPKEDYWEVSHVFIELSEEE